MRRQLPSREDLRIISRMAMFRDLSASDLRIIAASTHVQSFSRDVDIFLNGKTEQCFFGVISGWVKVYQNSPNGNCAITGLHTVGETFGEASLFLGPDFDADATTVDACRLCVFDHNAFDTILTKVPDLLFGMLEAISWHLKRANDELAQRQTLSGNQRLALFLLEMAERQGDCYNVPLPYDKMLIAKRLGMRPESLSRNFSYLRNFGVKVEHRNIYIHDVKLLESHLRDPARGH